MLRIIISMASAICGRKGHCEDQVRPALASESVAEPSASCWHPARCPMGKRLGLKR